MCFIYRLQCNIKLSFNVRVIWVPVSCPYYKQHLFAHILGAIRYSGALKDKQILHDKKNHYPQLHNENISSSRYDPVNNRGYNCITGCCQ